MSEYLRNRRRKSLFRDWKFHYSPEGEEQVKFIQTDFDDAAWRAVAIPHTWSTFETTGGLHPFIRDASEEDDPYWWYGRGYYRKTLIIGREYRDRRVFLEFDGVQKYSRLWVNGKFVGDHRGGFTSFSFDVTEHLRFGEINVVALSVSNRRDDPFGGIPPMTAGNWNVYGGIYRDVRVVITDRLHIPFQGSADHEGGTFVRTPSVSQDEGGIAIATFVRNDHSRAVEAVLKTKIFDPEGDQVLSLESSDSIAPGELVRFSQEGCVTDPNLWSPDSPTVYEVRSSLFMEGRRVDDYVSPLGFRRYRWDFDEKRLHLNGEMIHLHGTNRHQEYPWLGDAMPLWMHEEDIRDIRNNLGHNFMRTCHYPQDPEVYRLCDRYGILVCEEVPNIKNIVFGDEIQKRNVMEMIRRDRNHPCIVMWSMGNETDHAADGAWAREEDPDRIIHFRKVLGRGEEEPHNSEQIDMENLLRCTIRGWPSLDSLDPGMPNKPENHPNGQVTGTEVWQHTLARERDGSTRGRVDDNTVVWLYADHGADREYRNCPLKHVNPKGWTDAYRVPKYMYYLWKAGYGHRPMVFVHPHYWNRRFLGTRKDIVVDSNCDAVELRVGGEPVGSLRPETESFHTVVFPDVEVRDGTLEAVGKLGEETVSCSVPMPGVPSRILLSAQPSEIPADRSGISLVTVEVVDDEGRSVPGADPPIRWTVQGPGKLVGPELFVSDNGKRHEMEGCFYFSLPIRMPVRSTREAGIIEVTAVSEGDASLEPAAIRIRSVVPVEGELGGIEEPPAEDGPGETPPVGYRGLDHQPPAKSGSGGLENPQKISAVYEDIRFPEGDREEYRKRIDEFIRSKNPRMEILSEAYRVLLDGFCDLLERGRGVLIADDYNFLVQRYNGES